MKRKPAASNQSQKKVSRASDRASGRAGMRAATQKAARVRQRGGLEGHEADTEHLNRNH